MNLKVKLFLSVRRSILYEYELGKFIDYSKNSTMKAYTNAIITAATGYTEADLQVFLRSVERNCRNTKVFLIVYKRDRETIASLRSKYQFLEFVSIRKKVMPRGKYLGRITRQLLNPIFSYLSTKDHSSINHLSKALGMYPLYISIERYFIALQLVRAYGNSFSNILLTDSRDVVIQSDPFSLIDEKLVSGLEERTIGSCPWNSSWIKKVYGEDVLSQMLDRRIVCSGVTLGPTKEVENYLSEICSEIWGCLPRINFTRGGDQSIHNHLIFKGKIALDLTDNREGLIATLHYEQPANIIKEPANGLVQLYGNLPAIIHQYDRHRGLAEFIRERYNS
jgi:hypothetical protein